MYKNWRLFSFLAFFISLLLFITLAASPSSSATLIACDVGQGDALILQKGTTQVLIDGGPKTDKLLSCLSRHLPYWDRTIELIVITHTDSDHLGGISAALDRYQVGQIVTGDGVGESSALTRFIDTLDRLNKSVVQVSQGDSLIIGTKDKLHLKVLWPPASNKSALLALDPKITPLERENILGAMTTNNINERSVVLLVEENSYQALLVGDIGIPTEKELIAKKILPDVDLLKVAHHGSKYSTSPEFLSLIKPELALISVGKNSYGHPTQETLTRLKDQGVIIRRTDQEGDLVVKLSF